MDNSQDAFEPVNQVVLRGRLAAEPVVRELPSGDQLATFRLTVPRPAHERVRVDSIDCATTRPRLHRSLERLLPGDVVEVTGTLRRRFWRSPSGPTSRYAVDAEKITAMRRRRRPIAASPDPKRVSG